MRSSLEQRAAWRSRDLAAEDAGGRSRGPSGEGEAPAEPGFGARGCGGRTMPICEPRRWRRTPPTPRPSRREAQQRKRSTLGSIVELVVIIAVALGLALGIQAFIVKPYRIPSGSMEPTLSVGQRVLVNRIGMQLRNSPTSARSPSSTRPKDAEQEICGPMPHMVKVGGAACSQPEPEEIERQLHQAGRRRSRRRDLRSWKATSIRNGKRESRLLHPALRAGRRGVQLPDADHDSAPVTGS